LPGDIAAPYPLRLIARRMRDVNGSIGMHTAEIRNRNPWNPLHMNPADMQRHGIVQGALVNVHSPDGQVTAVAQADGTLRQGVVSMSHSWGGLENDPADTRKSGSSTNVLIRTTHDYEALNAMPRMSAIPVRVSAANTDSQCLRHDVLV